MKNLSLLILSLILSANLLHAQYDAELAGVVVEQNSQFNTGSVIYIPNASIKSPGAAASQLSQADGSFKLQYVDMPPGEVVRVFVQKRDYELVNDQVLQKAAITNRRVPLKVVMCRAGQLYENQVAYYNIAQSAAIESYMKKLAILEEGNEDSRRLIAQMQVDFKREINSKEQAIGLLHTQLKKIEKRAYELADKWVTTNLDDQSETYQRAFRAFLDKEIERAIAILDSVDLEKRLAINQSHQQKERALVDTLKQKIARRKIQIEQDIRQCLFKAELHELENDYSQAEKYYKLAVRYDPTNFDNLITLCSFLDDQNKSDLLISYARKMVEIAADSNERSFGLHYQGLALSSQNKHKEAIAAYEEALDLRRKLAENNPKRFEADVARTLNNLGTVYTSLNRYAEAIDAIEEALVLTRRLAAENPERFETYLANTLGSLGLAYTYLNRHEESIDVFEESLGLVRKRATENPDRFDADVARTLTNLGTVYSNLNRYAKAIDAYEEALAFWKKLALKNPERFEVAVATTLNNLGITYAGLNRYKEAIAAYEDALRLSRKLAAENPDRFEAAMANTLGNLGIVYFYLNRYEEAIAAYEESLDLYRKLATENPDHFELYVANTLNNLGELYADLNRYPEAIVSSKEALGTCRKLAAENPRVFGMFMGESYYILGTVHTSLFRISTAIRYFQQADSSYSLSEGNMHAKTKGDSARAQIIKLSQVDALAKALDHKGWTYYQDQQMDSARHYFDLALQAFEEIPADSLDIQGHDNASFLYEHLSYTESDYQKNYFYLKKAVQHRELVYDASPDNEKVKANLSAALNKLSWYALFTKSFEEAEQAAHRSLELFPESTEVISNLASALLFKGKYEEAFKYYQEWKNKAWPDDDYETFCEVFLSDLKELEDHGVRHADVEKVRAFLGSCEN